MVNQIYQIFRPFATMFFYRQFIKNDVVKDELRKHPGMHQAEAEARAEARIRNNEIPALDPAGCLRPGIDKIKEDPSSVGEVLGGWARNMILVYLGFVVFIILLIRALD